MKVIVIFNKFTDQYIGLTYATDQMNVDQSSCDETHFKYKTVEMDLDKEVWEGSYDDGSVIPIANQTTVITETELDADCQDKVFREYRYYHQLNIVYQLLDMLIEKSALDEALLTEYRRMRKYIDDTVANNERYKQAYLTQNGYEYRDKATERSVLNAQLEGGLHEVIGRAPHPGTPQ